MLLSPRVISFVAVAADGIDSYPTHVTFDPVVRAFVVEPPCE